MITKWDVGMVYVFQEVYCNNLCTGVKYELVQQEYETRPEGEATIGKFRKVGYPLSPLISADIDWLCNHVNKETTICKGRSVRTTLDTFDVRLNSGDIEVLNMRNFNKTGDYVEVKELINFIKSGSAETLAKDLLKILLA